MCVLLFFCGCYGIFLVQLNVGGFFLNIPPPPPNTYGFLSSDVTVLSNVEFDELANDVLITSSDSERNCVPDEHE